MDKKPLLHGAVRKIERNLLEDRKEVLENLKQTNEDYHKHLKKLRDDSGKRDITSKLAKIHFPCTKRFSPTPCHIFEKLSTYNERFAVHLQSLSEKI